MLIQSLALTLLAFLAGLLPAFALLGDPLLAARWATVPTLAALVFGLWHQGTVIVAESRRAINRAAVHPYRPILDQSPPAPQPEIPAVKPIESVRLVPIISHASEPRTTFVSDGNQLVSEERPVFPSQRLIDGVPEIDLKFFIEGFVSRGHSRSKWLGVRMPSGAKVTPQYHALLIAPLVKTKCIEGRGERVAGSLTCSPQTMKKRLDLAP